MRDDIYGRLGSWPRDYGSFAAKFRNQYDGPPHLETAATEAAHWLSRALEDIDALQTRWDCLSPEIRAALGKDWLAFFE